MSPEQQRIKIAEACGKTPWLKCYKHSEVLPDSAVINRYGTEICPWCGAELSLEDCPDYLNDLNAMHEAEKTLPDKHKRTFAFMLAQVLDTSPTVDLDDQFANIHATAAQRAEAFRKTLNLWEDAP